MRAGMELAQENDVSATRTQENFTRNPKFLPMSPELRADRMRRLSRDETSWARRVGFHQISAPDWQGLHRKLMHSAGVRRTASMEWFQQRESGGKRQC